MRTGRVVAAKNERAEKTSERAKMQKSSKRNRIVRTVFVTLLYLVLFGVIIYLGFIIMTPVKDNTLVETVVLVPAPTIAIIDEDSYATDGKISSRMTEFIGQLEGDLRDLGYTPAKAVIPSGSIREIDFYIDGCSGYFKTTIDRGTAVLAEDIDRMIRYLNDKNISDYEYVDVRIEGKAYWK